MKIVTFFTTEQFTGHSCAFISLDAALEGCERILDDEFKDYPESALYMIGAVDQAKEKAARSREQEDRDGNAP